MRDRDATLKEDLSRWRDVACAYTNIASAAEQIVEADWSDVHEQLAEIWKDPAIQIAMLFAQPRLYRNLEKLFSGDDIERKRSETAFLAYCYRAASKTSPFSTLTEVGIGSTTGKEGSDPTKAFSKTCGYVTLNAAIVQKIASTVLADVDFRESLPITLNEIMIWESALIHVLVSGPYHMQHMDDETSEVIRTISITAAIDVALRLASPIGRGYRTISELTLELAKVANVDVARAVSLIGKLMDCGLVEPRLNYNANDRRAIESLVELLSVHASDRVRQAAEPLSKVQPAVDAIRNAPPKYVSELLQKIRYSVSDALEILGETLPPSAEQTLVHHNLVASQIFHMNSSMLEAFRPGLAQFMSILPLFNRDFPYRSLVRETFLDVYGPNGECTNVLEFFHVLCERAPVGDKANQHEDPVGYATSGSAAAHLMGELQQEFAKSLRHLLAKSSPVSIPSSFWDEWARRAQLFAASIAPLSVAFAGQISLGSMNKSSPQFVLNKVHSGYGTLFAAYASESDASPQEWLTKALRRSLPEINLGAQVVELVGTFAFDGLIRPRLTKNYLIYPGEPHKIESGGQIPWDDLTIHLDPHNPHSVLLKRKTTNQDVIPVHLGTLDSAHLPPFYRFIKCFGPAFSPAWSLIDILESVAPPDSTQVRYYPRVVYDNIVLSRETWCVPSEQIPRSVRGGDEFSRFRSLRRWAQDLGLPKQCFVTPMRVPDFLQSDLPGQSFRRARKPFYVDWDDLVSHQLFHRYTKVGNSTLTISEALPDCSNSAFCKDGQSYNAEYILELSGR